MQLRRYMAGDEIPEPLLDELRQHINGCDGCKAESVRLRDVLASVVPGSSPAPGNEPARRGASPLGKLLAMLPSLPEGRLKSALKAPKTVGMSIALAVVIVLLTTVFRNPTASLGPKVAETVAASAEDGGSVAEDGNPSHSVEGGESPASDDHSPTKAAEDPETAAADGDGTESGSGEESEPAGVHEPETDFHAPVGGKVVVAGGNGHETPPVQPGAALAKSTSNPKPAARRRTSTVVRKAPPKPAAKVAAPTKPADTGEPYVKVYK